MAIATFLSIGASIQAQDVFQQLYAFPASGSDPKHPGTVLTEDRNGDFYGVTVYGGSNRISSANGDGTIFKITKAGVLTSLFSFNATNGGSPSGGLVFGNDGNLYGTTARGGSNYAGQFAPSGNDGTVFKFTTNGVSTSLLSFKGTDGNGPSGPLALDADANLYGISASGGTFGLGTAFKISTNGTLTLLFSSTGTNGSSPNWKLTRGNDGLFYGTTAYGGSIFSGPSTGRGTLFRITTKGFLTTLLSFDGTNGSNAWAGLVHGLDNSFYGTTAYRAPAGPSGYGTIFEVTMSGTLSTLVFLNGTNGIHPFTDMTLGTDGNLYGAMADATLANAGAIYRIFQSLILMATLANGGVKLSWNSFSNGVYRIEYKSALTDSDWTNFVPDVAATGNTTFYTDSSESASERFYRVALLR